LFTTSEESVVAESFKEIVDFDALFALAKENKTSEKDTISARRKRCFFMAIGVFPVIGGTNFRRKIRVIKETEKH